MKTERVTNAHGCVEYLPVHDGVREFYDREVVTPERMNNMLRLTSKAHARAKAATRLLWLGILLTLVDIALLVRGML